MNFQEALAKLPLIAILRGVRPAESVAIGEALVAAGFTLIEVPLNSPDPLDSIKRVSEALKGQAIIGAGTVLHPEQVRAVRSAGGKLIVSPNTDGAVIAETVNARMISLPGVFTPTEALSALSHGANGVKLFPAEASSPTALKAWLAVLPPETKVFPVGGIDETTAQAWRASGATGLGLGSAVYRPGDQHTDVARKAKAITHAWGRALP